MAVLAAFSPPAALEDAHADKWNTVVRGIVRPYARRFRQFYDPTADDTPAEAQTPTIAWTAFPATLVRGSTSQEGRWQKADAKRAAQDEYCEWSVERNAEGKLTDVTFTTELPEYWAHLADTNRDGLVELYRTLVSPKVEPSHLFDGRGRYNPINRWNNSTQGRLAHLIQQNNNLGAAVTLVAEATVLRQRNGEPVTNKQELVDCAGLGNPFRNSDPQIAAAVNDAAATGAEITMQDPFGLYIQGLQTTGITAPDGANPATFWKIERGNAQHTLRARFAVPPERGYTVGDLKIGGRPLNFGAQLADRVVVKVTAIVKPAQHRPRRRPCIS